jgi:prepilin-type N-terminal cleavage/methylation domain-containing protein
MNRRHGTTLVEVLVAIFVMGIGMLALLTLFPLGAASMAQAIKDARAAHSAAKASAVAEFFIDPDINNAANPNSTSVTLGIRNNPNITGAFATPGGLASLNTNNYDGPSYAVYVDPFGFYSSLPPFTTWVAGKFQPGVFGIPRRSLRLFDQPPNLLQQRGTTRDNLIRRYFTLQDDIVFDKNSGLADLGTGQVERESSYSWAYLVRRPRRPLNNEVDISIVVYNQRPLRLTGGVNPTEYAYNATFDNTQNVITMSWNPANGEVRPPLRSGGWVLDATIFNGQPHGFFYRVIEITEIGPTSLQLTCETPFKEFPATATNNGVIMVLEGVAEVIEKRSGWLP